MSRFHFYFSFILFSLSLSYSANAQEFADKEYYLIDSLEIESISNTEKSLLDSCLKVYHKAKYDSSRINAIDLFIEKSLDDNLWPKYNQWMFDYVTIKLETQLTPKETIVYKKALANAFDNIGYYYQNIKGVIPIALEYYLKSLQIRKDIGDEKSIIISNNNIGDIYVNKGNSTLGLEYYNKALELNKKIKDKEGLSNTYNNLGSLYYDKGDMALALEYHTKSLQIRLEIADKNGASTSYNNIALIYDSQGNSDLALEYLHKSLKMVEDLENKNSIAVNLHNIGGIYRDKLNHSKALEYYSKSMVLFQETNDENGIAHSILKIGYVYEKQGFLDKALINYKKSLVIFEKINNKKVISDALDAIAGIEFKNNNIKKAYQFSIKSLEIAEELGYPENIKISARTLYKIYEKLGKNKEALEMHKLFITMRDSLDNKDVQKHMAQEKFRVQHEREKEIEKIKHDKEQEVLQAELKAKKTQQYALYGGVLLLILFLIFVFNRLKITKQQKHVIEETNEELNQTNEEIAAQRDEIELQKVTVEKQHTNIISSITYAKRIQTALLKNEEHESDHLPPHFILFKPKDIVSGDFYWALEKQGHLFLAAVDCTGHGVPGGFLTMLGTSFLNEINSTAILHSPATVLDKLRDKIVLDLSQNDGISKDGMDISLIRLNLSTFEAEWAGANNPLYILPNGNSEIQITKGDKEPIGHYDKQTAFTNHSFKLNKGDSFYLFTDGYPDQFGGEKGRKLGYKTFREKLIELNSLPMNEQKSHLDSFFKEWSGYEKQIDDICVIGVKI